MSRIAGLVRRAGDVGAMLTDSLAGMRVDAGARPHVTEHDGVALGWVGAGEPNLHEDEHVACVVDGAVYGEAGPAASLIARRYIEHGMPGTLDGVNGDFAIALHDRRDGSVWLGRDRFGVRPLYHLDGEAFASRPRPLLRLDGVSHEPDPIFVALFAGSHYRYFDNDPESSPYAAISQVPQAHVVRLPEVEKRRWWSLEEQPDLDGSPHELAERYRELLLDAVRIRFEHAAAPAFTLSGGMDSSSVLASAVHLSGSRQHAYSTLYSGSEYDESEEIRSMLEAAVEEWHQVLVDAPDVLGLVTQMIDAHDEPVATATWLSHHVLCGTVANHGFDTLFGGLGGDELNAGEYEYFLYRFADLRAAGDEARLRAEVAEWAKHHDHPIFRKDWDVMEEGLARLTDPSRPGRIVPDRGRLERYNGALRNGDLREFQPVLDHPFTSYLKNRTYQDIFRETAPCCLRAEDRQTAAHGLRNCDPFFDHRLVELMFRVPGELKIADGVTKQLLRRATTGLLPEETRTRIKKTGWNAPADAWFSGPGRELLHDLVGSASFKAASVYDVEEVRRLIDEHDEIVMSGRPQENHMMFFWQLVNLELWLRWLDEL